MSDAVPENIECPHGVEPREACISCRPDSAECEVRLCGVCFSMTWHGGDGSCLRCARLALMPGLRSRPEQDCGA